MIDDDKKLLIEELIAYASAHLHLQPLDVRYTRNLLLNAFKLDAPLDYPADVSYVLNYTQPDLLIEKIGNLGVESGIIAENEKELFTTYIMGLLTPYPSVVNSEFQRLKVENGIQAACDYLYDMSIKNDYIKKSAIDKNVKWEYKDKNNYLEITVNLSKPEKDNKKTAELLKKPATPLAVYPECFLCKENEGFKGNASHPARENIRTISFKLANENWFMQYSPYAYYDEHCIVISESHKPMSVDKKTPQLLVDFVDLFPNYFLGSNAALKIVGGSILNHAHFQGGRHLLPMFYAVSKGEYFSKDFPETKIDMLDWYNSAIKLTSSNRAEIISLATKVILCWEKYSDSENGIFAYTDEQHNAVNPICRKNSNGEYEFYLILRNNITNETYPDGVFHAHSEYFNIKKESIGLIEAMGLFILPGRLKRQSGEIADILSGKIAYDKGAIEKPENDLFVHKDMINQLVKEYGTSLNEKQAEIAIKNKINEVCKNILGCTAVFKNTQCGTSGFERFMANVGLNKK